MQITVCDFCKEKVKEESLEFIYAGARHRIAIRKVQIKHGVRWHTIDVCIDCIRKHLNREKPK